MPELKIVVCRSIDADLNRLQPGFAAAKCGNCQGIVQLSPQGQKQVANGAKVLCNHCGLGLYSLAAPTARVELNPAFVAQQHRHNFGKK